MAETLLSPIISNHELDLAVGRNGFGYLNSVVSRLSLERDFGNGILGALPTGPSMGMANLDMPFDNAAFQDLASTAMDELINLVQHGSPLWIGNIDGSGEMLNFKEYASKFPHRIGMNPDNFITEAIRAIGNVSIKSLALVEALMDVVSC